MAPAIDLRRFPNEELAEITSLASPLSDVSDLDRLVDAVADARVVCLGEASHGTSEYYRWRAVVTRRLIEEHGFSFVGVEGDWPDCFTVNRWVKDRGDTGAEARQVLGRFERWPTWMWANEEVADFASWLRDHNRRTGSGIGFYGLDVYSLWDSLYRLRNYLHDEHPEALQAASEALRCFEPYGEDAQRYAWSTRLVPEGCQSEVVELLTEMRRSAPALDSDPEAEFDAQQNAEVVAGAERYYRTMVRGDGESWNIRDHHMVDTVDRLLRHHGRGAKAVVWEHNTHIGDARATDMAAAGMVNVGQLVRERYSPANVRLVGFSGHRGHVIAAGAWGDRMQRLPVPAAPSGTHEDLLEHALAAPSVLVFPDDRDTPWLSARRGHRAIGVVYAPDRDPYGNWVPTVMGRRYDALLAFGETSALHPLHMERARAGEELETFPWTT